MIITENIKDHVMFSNLFVRHWPKLYRSLDDILTKNGIPHGTIMHTKDYWCRDYMPVQYDEGKFAQFIYNPDYLQD